MDELTKYRIALEGNPVWEAKRLECDALKEENTRLAREHQEVHDWNMKLVGEHYDLGDRIKKFRELLVDAIVLFPLDRQTEVSRMWLKKLAQLYIQNR